MNTVAPTLAALCSYGELWGFIPSMSFDNWKQARVQGRICDRGLLLLEGCDQLLLDMADRFQPLAACPLAAPQLRLEFLWGAGVPAHLCKYGLPSDWDECNLIACISKEKDIIDGTIWGGPEGLAGGKLAL